MEHIDFVLWMVLYPIGYQITSYLGVKIRGISKKEPYTDETVAFAAVVNIVIWFAIGAILY